MCTHADTLLDMMGDGCCVFLHAGLMLRHLAANELSKKHSSEDILLNASISEHAKAANKILKPRNARTCTGRHGYVQSLHQRTHKQICIAVFLLLSQPDRSSSCHSPVPLWESYSFTVAENRFCECMRLCSRFLPNLQCRFVGPSNMSCVARSSVLKLAAFLHLDSPFQRKLHHSFTVSSISSYCTSLLRSMYVAATLAHAT